MDGLLHAAGDLVRSIVMHGLASSFAQAECVKLARNCVRLSLVLAEMQLCLVTDESLRGSKSVFLAVDCAVGALRQAEQLVAQCAGTAPGSIWPAEDAVEFQAVAAELRSAAGGLAALGARLPPDVQRDACHVFQQLAALAFTAGELSETEELELERVQQSNANAAASPRHPAAAAAAAAVAPPAAPAHQFERPGEALASGAVAASQREAARARLVVSLPPSAEEVEERRAVAGAAAVATEAAAEVLAADGDAVEEGEAAGPGGAPPGEPQGEEESALAAELRAEALPGGCGEAVVLTPAGEIALAPEAPAKGAVPSRGASPLPPDPFALGAGLGSNTLRELRSFQRGQEDLAVADEAQRALEAGADNLSLHEQQHCVASGGGEARGQGAQALAALKQLQGYEAAMEAGEDAEEAGSGCSPRSAAPAAPLHKSRSQAAADVLDANLAQLSSEFLPPAAALMEGGGGGAQAVAAAPAGAQD